MRRLNFSGGVSPQTIVSGWRICIRRSVVRLLLLALGLGCSSVPDWVHRLPDAASVSASASVLTGAWERPVEPRQSVMLKTFAWKGSERIVIDADSYEKIHLYAELFEGRYAGAAYRERGKITRRGPWVLFQPASAELFRETKTSAAQPASASAPRPSDALQLPDVGRAAFVKVAARPLLFFLDEATNTLTPLVFERLGEQFDYGLYEGAAGPHDRASLSFQEALAICNVKAFHKHGYARVALPVAGAGNSTEILK